MFICYGMQVDPDMLGDAKDGLLFAFKKKLNLPEIVAKGVLEELNTALIKEDNAHYVVIKDLPEPFNGEYTDEKIYEYLDLRLKITLWLADIQYYFFNPRWIQIGTWEEVK